MKLWTRRPAVRFVIFFVVGAPIASAFGQSSRDSWSPRKSDRASAVATDRGAAPAGGGPIALLVRNPDTSNGAPPYALLDQFGQVQRHIEPSPGINLSRHVGARVRIRHDTGPTLLASQLDLSDAPRSLREASRPFSAIVPADFAPPSRGERLTSPRYYAVIPAQLNEDDTAPIALEDLLNEDDDSLLPTPDDGPRAEHVAPSVDDYEEVPAPTRNHYSDHSHSADCPHCSANHSSSSRRSSRLMTSPSASCGCSKCRNEWQPECTACRREPAWCGPSCSPASRRGFYGRVEYLLWQFDGMNTPPLVTAGTVASQGVLGQPGTSVLYGGNLLDDTRNGLRFTLGAWLDDQRDFGIEFDHLSFETEGDFYSVGDPTGTSVIGRPFYNLNNLAEDAQLVSYPNNLAGTVSVRSRSAFESTALRLRTGLCCCELGGGCGQCQTGGQASGITRVDFILGYRCVDLDESLQITENLTSLQTANPGTFNISDQFDVDNEFHGVDLGFIYGWEARRWGVELTSKIALGNTRQRVGINGSTTIADGGASFTDTGGLLALPSNIGSYSRDQFSVLPELSARLTYRLTPRLRASIAYSLLYWSNVVRPGDQIDLNVDENGIPPAVAATARPQFAFHETALWASGFNLGLDYNY